MKQEYTSSETSINQIPAVYTKFPQAFGKGDRVLDYGGGKYDTTKEYMAQFGVKVDVYDPFNRSVAHNKKITDAYKMKKADVIVCANVLNVIKEPEVIEGIIHEIMYKYAGANTIVIFQVYEGDKSGKGKVTTKGYQRNQPASSYSVFFKRAYRGKMIRKGRFFISASYSRTHKD